MKIECLLLDLDDTILDFAKSEDAALERTLREFGISPAEDVKERYIHINKGLWKQLELGQITREELKVVRFARLFGELGIEADAEKAARDYLRYLGMGHWFLPGAEEAVASLSGSYRLFLASNGNADVQKGRMTSANLYRFFEDCFVSEELGADKPTAAFFERAFARIDGFDPERTMIVGDSLTSDILGGLRAGIHTCWVNPKHRPVKEDIVPHYQIDSLSQLPQLLAQLEKTE